MDTVSKFSAVLLILVGSQVLGNHDARRLYDDLLMKNKYNKLIRPVENATQKILVEIGIRLLQIMDVDERNEILMINMWVRQEWEDVNLMWNPLEYGGVQLLHVPSELLWLPDILLYNNADGEYVLTTMTKASVTYWGKVRWEPPTIFKPQCDIDVEYFPFDEQVCKLKLGSWSYDGLQIDLKHIWHEPYGLVEEEAVVDPGMDLSDYYRSVEWDLMGVPAKKNIIFYPCCDEPYPDITFNITIRRKPLYYAVNLVVPCMTMTLLTILVFYLPPDAGEKISLTISILVSLSIFQMLLMEIVPPTSITTPLIGKYILFTTVVNALSVLTTTLVLNVHFRSSSHTAVHWLTKKVFLGVLPRLLLMKRPEPEDEDEDMDTDFDGPHGDLSNYKNPYKSKFKPRQGVRTTEELYGETRYSTSFVGFENVDFRRMSGRSLSRLQQYPMNVQKGFESLMFIAKHLKDQDDEEKEDWKYIAMVFDRLLLWIYVSVCTVGTLGMLCNAPALYDSTEPIRTTN